MCIVLMLGIRRSVKENAPALRELARKSILDALVKTIKEINRVLGRRVTGGSSFKLSGQKSHLKK